MGFKTHDVAAVRVDYGVLSAATNRFDESRYLVGAGGSCRVFKAEVYGHPVAIKIFNETDGAWDDKQVSE